jgi:hypothetical protein
MINNNIPYLRKEKPTFLALSAIALLLLSSSPLLPLSNLLVQPVQAQTTMTFKTPTPASGNIQCCPENAAATITFDAQGTASSSDSQSAKITNGTFQISSSDGGQKLLGSIDDGTFTNNSRVGSLNIIGKSDEARGYSYSISSECSTSESNDISLEVNSLSGELDGDFSGPVECSSSQGGDTTQSSMTGSTQDRDSDSDGIPDSTDNCPHNSHHRCFKEGTSTTSTNQQQPSSSNGNGNQTGQ